MVTLTIIKQGTSNWSYYKSETKTFTKANEVESYITENFPWAKENKWGFDEEKETYFITKWGGSIDTHLSLKIA